MNAELAPRLRQAIPVLVQPYEFAIVGSQTLAQLSVGSTVTHSWCSSNARSHSPSVSCASVSNSAGVQGALLDRPRPRYRGADPADAHARRSLLEGDAGDDLAHDLCPGLDSDDPAVVELHVRAQAGAARGVALRRSEPFRLRRGSPDLARARRRRLGRRAISGRSRGRRLAATTTGSRPACTGWSATGG